MLIIGVYGVVDSCRLCAISTGVFFFFQAEDGIRDLVRSRGLGDVYKRQVLHIDVPASVPAQSGVFVLRGRSGGLVRDAMFRLCLLYTSDAADDLLCVDLGGRRIIKKKNHLDPLAYSPHFTLQTHLLHTYPIYHTH